MTLVVFVVPNKHCNIAIAAFVHINFSRLSAVKPGNEQ